MGCPWKHLEALISPECSGIWGIGCSTIYTCNTSAMWAAMASCRLWGTIHNVNVIFEALLGTGQGYIWDRLWLLISAHPIRLGRVSMPWFPWAKQYYLVFARNCALSLMAPVLWNSLPPEIMDIPEAADLPEGQEYLVIPLGTGTIVLMELWYCCYLLLRFFKEPWPWSFSPCNVMDCVVDLFLFLIGILSAFGRWAAI